MKRIVSFVLVSLLLSVGGVSALEVPSFISGFTSGLSGVFYYLSTFSSVQRCVTTADCPTGEYCYLHSGRCMTYKSEGDYCTASYQCASDACLSSECVGAVTCYSNGHSCVHYSQCCSNKCDTTLSKCVQYYSKTTTTVRSSSGSSGGSNNNGDDVTTVKTSTPDGCYHYHGLTVCPEKDCWDSCWSKDYAWGDCYGRDPSDSMNQWVKNGAVGAFECSMFQSCYCRGTHQWSDSQGLIGTDTTDDSIKVVNNPDGSTTIVSTEERRTPTVCEETCRRAGFLFGDCMSYANAPADLWFTSDSFIGEKGDLGCPASEKCLCLDAYDDSEMEEYASRFNVERTTFFNETHIIRIKEEQNRDPAWEFIMRYWKTILLFAGVLILFMVFK